MMRTMWPGMAVLALAVIACGEEWPAWHVSPSPVSAAGNLYFLDDDGQTTVIRTGPTFEVVARNALGEQCRASPAISRGRIFVRAVGNLYCIGAAKN